MWQLPEDFGDRLREGLARWETTSLRLADQGWTAPGLLTPADVYDLLEGCDTADEVDAAFFQLFDADGGSQYELIASDLLSSPTVIKWHTLLTQVFSAYRRGDYLVTIPSLLLVLEGVLATDAGCSTNVKAMVRARVSDAAVRLPGSLTLVEWRAQQKFVNQLFGNSDFDKTPPGSLNRHWVLHGRDAVDWTPADSLRLTVALETICSLLEPSRGLTRASSRTPEGRLT